MRNEPNDAQRTYAGKWLSGLVAVVLGLVLCETFVRVVSPHSIYYSTWFTDGVHEPDDQFGFVFTGNYGGAMRNADGVWMEPLRLQNDGLRTAATKAASSEAAPQRIAVLGAASMAFSYGLQDEETLHHQLSDQLPNANQIELFSWPGFTLEQDVAKLDRFGDPSSFDMAIVFAYSDQDFRIVDQWPQLPRGDDLNWIGSVVVPSDPAASIFGRLYYRSRFLAGLARLVQVPLRILGSDANPVIVGDEVRASGDPLVLLAANRLLDMNVKRVWIVALPRLQGKLTQSLPASDDTRIKTLDLRDVLQGMEMRPGDWIAGGHYGPRLSEAIAQQMARAIDQ